MSLKLMNLVWEQDMPLGPKMLLLCLADHANDEGEGYPGTDTICARCSFSPASLYRHLASLEDEEFLARHQMGDRTLYVLNVERIRQLPLSAHKQVRKTKGLADIHPVKVRAKHSQIESADSQNESGDSQIESLSICELGPLNLRVGTSQFESPIKQPSVNHQEPSPRASAEGHGDQWPKLNKRQQSLVSGYGTIPSSLRLDVFCAYVDHRAVKRRELSGPAWMLVRRDLLAMEAKGVDLNESLELTIRRGLVDPVAPEKQKTATPRVNDDLSGTVYEPNDLSKLPAHLRPGAAVGSLVD